MAKKALGTTVSFASTPLGEVTGCRVRIGGDDLDITAFDSTEVEQEAGAQEVEVEVDILGAGAGTLTRGATGSLVFTPADSSGARTFTNMYVASIALDSNARGILSATVVFKHGAA